VCGIEDELTDDAGNNTTFEQVNYSEENEWNTWGLAAKKRILLEDGNSRIDRQAKGAPLSEYSVSLRRVSGAGTQVSSLEGNNTPSSKASSGNSQWTDELTVAMVCEEEANKTPDDGEAPYDDVLGLSDNDNEDHGTAANAVTEDKVGKTSEEVSSWIGGALHLLSKCQLSWFMLTAQRRWSRQY
jgi:hypothetical protein